MAKRSSQYPWFHRYIKAQIDRVWGWCPQRKAALERARVANSGNEHRWRCEECDAQPLKRTERDVDHLEARVPVEGWDSWDGYIRRSFVPPDKLMVKCKPCHKRKSESENKVRRASRKKAVTR